MPKGTKGSVPDPYKDPLISLERFHAHVSTSTERLADLRGDPILLESGGKQFYNSYIYTVACMCTYTVGACKITNMILMSI